MAGIIAGVLVLALVVATGVVVWKLNRNVHRVDVSMAVGTDRPTQEAAAPNESKPLNILVLGSDTRKNLDDTSTFGPDTVEGGDHSDTNVLVHISADRKAVLAVSIPRDSMVPAPKDCKAETPKSQWVVRQWNYNYNKGGAGCTIRTLEGNTGVFVDHYAVVNFKGFQSMVDALGGIEVCTPVAIDDPASGLDLTPGRHVLDGSSALGYVRARKTLGDGSDINRIKRQQAFMSSVVQKAVSTEMLKRPDKLYSFLNAATKSLTTDPDLGLTEMATVAKSLQDVGAENIQFVTVPTTVYQPDPNRVQWTDDADLIWEAIRGDHAIGAAPTASPSPTGTESPAALTVTPDKIAVQVLNGSGVRGLATQAVEALQVQGFRQVTRGDAPAQTTGVLVEYSPMQEDAARTVAAAFPGAVMRQASSLGNTVVVTLGVGAPDVVEVPNRLGTQPLPTPSISSSPTSSSSPSTSGTTSPSPSPSISTRSADENICS
ncbi:MAG: LCP family protein [Tetrasphaera sp.]|nr:LCP family protein [Tetrasphaera sp.]